METIQLTRFGPPHVLQPGLARVPRPDPGQVLIEVEAVGIGFAQTQMRAGTFPAPFWRPEMPLVLGGDVVGRIVKVGEGVDGFCPGDRVAAYVLTGANAQYVVAAAEALIGVPDALDAAAATVLAGTGPIAAGLLDVASPRVGEAVLVHAGAGGVGHIAVQLARMAGAGLVISTASTPAKRDFVTNLGADLVVDTTVPEWAQHILGRTDGRGVDVVLDGVGGAVTRESLKILAPEGRLVFFGAAGGSRATEIDAMALMRGQSVRGFMLSAWRSQRRTRSSRAVAHLVGALTAGHVRSVIDRRLDMSQVAHGHLIIESRAHRGRVVLLVSGDKLQ
jgi:NADPH2:quinone reductase